MEDLIISLRAAPIGELASNMTVGMLANAWQSYADRWMQIMDAARMRKQAYRWAVIAIGLAASYATTTTKCGRREIKSYVPRSMFKGRRTFVRRGSCIAFLNHILVQASLAPIAETRSELPSTYVYRITRWLNGDHPEHEEYSESQVSQELKQRLDAIMAWLTWNEDLVLAWEEQSRGRNK